MRNSARLLTTFLMAVVPIAQGQPTPKAIDALAQKTFANARAPGFALTVTRNGQTLFSRGYGVADLATNEPVSPVTRFAVGSISKQFAAVSILQLMQRGKLSLDDPLAKYLPSLPNAARITLRMLLHQTSGLQNYPQLAEHPWPRAGEIPMAKLAAIMATDKPGITPGERFEYSNTNYFALAFIVEKVSGMPYRRYLKENIFTPLHMDESGDGFADQAGIATPYGGQSRPGWPAVSLDLYQGAGAVVSTAADMALWDEALLTGKVLEPASMKLLWTPGTPAQGERTYAMGFVAASVAGHRELWHNGITPTAGGYNFNALFPDDHLAIVILSNGADFRPQPELLVKEIVDAFFPANPAQPPAPPQAPPAAPATAAPAEDPAEDPAMTALALKIYRQMRAGKVDPALLTDAMNKALSPEVIAPQKPIFDQLGDPTRLTLTSRRTEGGLTIFEYLATFVTAQLHVRIVVDSAGKVAGYFLAL